MAARRSFAAALQWAKGLPKAELHLHLDGSLSPTFVARRAKALGVEMPCAAQELGTVMRSRSRATMAKSLSVFDWLNLFLQTEEDLYDATTEMLQLLADDNVVYSEIRFCPSLHCDKGLTPGQAVDAVLRAVDDSPSWANVIVCALRSWPSSHSSEMARLAASSGACGFDIAGDEQLHPLSKHRDAIQYCASQGVPMTLHAGEWPGTLDNVRFAVNHGVQRLGHGVALAEDVALMDEVKVAGIAVECCPTANVGGTKVAAYGVHPIKTFHAAGLLATINSDNLLVSGSQATGQAYSSGEAAHLVADVGMSEEECRQVIRNAAECAFVASDAEREALRHALA